MDTYRAKLKLKGSFLTPFKADTIFGGLCWQIRYNEGEKILEEFVAKYREGVPPLVLSNAFPRELFPRPLARTGASKERTSETKSELLKRFSEAKRIKETIYFNQDGFQHFCQGESLKTEWLEKDQQVKRVILKNQISRLLGSVGSNGELYPQEETFLSGDNPYFSLYLRIDPEWKDIIYKALTTLGQSGLGKRRSVGYGAFDISPLEPAPFLEAAGKAANGFVSLSDFVPASHDPTEGWWQVYVKYGKLSETYGLENPPFKRPLLMLRAGSCFRVKGPVRAYYGRMVEGLVPDLPQVVHYALAFAVPITLPV